MQALSKYGVTKGVVVKRSKPIILDGNTALFSLLLTCGGATEAKFRTRYAGFPTSGQKRTKTLRLFPVLAK